MPAIKAYSGAIPTPGESTLRFSDNAGHTRNCNPEASKIGRVKKTCKSLRLRPYSGDVVKR